jgi:hypothetical protein
MELDKRQEAEAKSVAGAAVVSKAGRYQKLALIDVRLIRVQKT